MAAIQMESAAPPCRECKGEKTVAFRTCEHVGNCPCGDYAEEPCPRCEGSGVEPCDHCGEPSTGRDVVTEQPVCATCDRSEDGPLGGMGYGIEYNHEMHEDGENY